MVNENSILYEPETILCPNLKWFFMVIGYLLLKPQSNRQNISKVKQSYARECFKLIFMSTI